MELQTTAQAPRWPQPLAPLASDIQALACVLEYRPGAYAALPIQSSVELVERPHVIPVPGNMPAFALGLMPWQGRHIPLIDIAAYLHGDPLAVDGPLEHVLVVAYQPRRNAPLEYAALCAPFLVRMSEVTNDQACSLPPYLNERRSLVLACFQYQAQVVPILDLACLFAAQAMATAEGFSATSIEGSPS
jgi:chemotaxis signal transduction protein